MVVLSPVTRKVRKQKEPNTPATWRHTGHTGHKGGNVGDATKHFTSRHLKHCNNHPTRLERLDVEADGAPREV